MKARTWVVLGAVVALGGGALWMGQSGNKQAVKFREAQVERGSLRQRITATGILSALVQVNVGTQVSGAIAGLYVDYNSEVKKGQPIAQIDPTLFQASVQDASAAVAKVETALEDAQRQLARAKRLFEAKLISQQDLDDKQVLAAKAENDLKSTRATLEKAKANLGYCTIQAPVSGVVVSRSVDVGQTVAASFNTPTLFVIAQDLTKMKVEAAIDEADIGQVKAGQMGYFTVDSYPDTQFQGRVSQVRLEPITQQNVVIYKVVIQVENQELKLRPGMTANVNITVQTKDDVLKVPAAALRFNPAAFLTAEERQGKGEAQANPAAKPRGLIARREDRVWTLKKGKPAPLPVKAGITDGQFTEVSGEGLDAGLAVLVGVEETKKGPAPIGGMRR